MNETTYSKAQDFLASQKGWSVEHQRISDLEAEVARLRKANAEFKFRVGDIVAKTTGDYVFLGEVRAAFKKKSGLVRYVVENDDGILFIFNEGSLDGVMR